MRLSERFFWDTFSVLLEIINRITEPGKTAFKKIQDLLYDATFGLVREYQRKTLELARLTAASYYIQGVKALRKAAITLFLVTLATVVFSMAVVVVPVAVVLVSPWAWPQKVIAVLALGLLDAGAALVFLAHLFSEERWMKITKSQEFVDKIMNP